MKGLNKTNLVMWVKQPMVIISLVIAMLWCLSDMANRLLYSLDLSDLVLPESSLSELPIKNLTEEQIGNINSLFLPLYPQTESKKTAPEIQGLTQEQQAAQQGELNEVFVDNKKLQLKAIIIKSQQQEITALINIVDITTGEQKLEQFSKTNKIYGFDLQILNNTQILLTAQHGEHQQRITLSMFKASISNSESPKAKK